MADTITIGTTTYHKLVTFSDCAGSESGQLARFPYAFIKLQDNGNYFDAVEIRSNKYIVEPNLTDTFLDSKNPVRNNNIGSTTFYHCVCANDLKISTNDSKNPKVSLYMSVNNVTNYNYITASLHETSQPYSGDIIKTIFSQKLYGNAGLKEESSTWNKSLLLPSNTGTGIRVVNQKNNTDTGYLRISFFVNNDEGFRLEKSKITSIASNSLDNLTNYCKLWSICKLANKNDIVPKFEFTHVS